MPVQYSCCVYASICTHMNNHKHTDTLPQDIQMRYTSHSNNDKVWKDSGGRVAWLMREGLRRVAWRERDSGEWPVCTIIAAVVTPSTTFESLLCGCVRHYLAPCVAFNHTRISFEFLICLPCLCAWLSTSGLTPLLYPPSLIAKEHKLYYYVLV